MSPATFGRWLAVLVTVLAGGGTESVARAADVAFDWVGGGGPVPWADS